MSRAPPPSDGIPVPIGVAASAEAPQVRWSVLRLETVRGGAGVLPLVFAAVGSERPDPPIFSLDVTPGDDGSTTVSVAGELDLATADEFARAVRSGLARGPVLIDLREVTFMDSSGVRALNT